MKKKLNNKLISIALFWITIICLPLAFTIIAVIGNVSDLGIGIMIRYMWFSCIFTPIPIISVIYGKKLKYKKNIIVGIIILPLLIIYGSFSIIFKSNFSYDYEKVNEISIKLNIDLPSKGKISTEKKDENQFISNIKFTDKKEINTFVSNIEMESKWIKELKSNMISMLPQFESILIKNGQYEYFIFYNETLSIFNQYPDNNGEYIFTFLGYDKTNSKLIVIKWVVVINN